MTEAQTQIKMANLSNRIDEILAVTNGHSEIDLGVNRIPSAVSYDVGDTALKAIGYLLFKDIDSRIRIQHVEADVGAATSFHDYGESLAICILYKGKQRVEYSSDRETETLEAGGFTILLPFEGHKNTVIEKVKGVVITMPAAKGYPDNEKTRA